MGTKWEQSGNPKVETEWEPKWELEPPRETRMETKWEQEPQSGTRMGTTRCGEMKPLLTLLLHQVVT